MLQNVIDETHFYIFYWLSSPSIYLQLTHSHSQNILCFNFHQHIEEFSLVPIQVKTTITRYQPLINRRGRNSLCSRPSNAKSIKLCRFSWPREFLNIVLMLFIEENFLSHSAVDGQRIKVETQSKVWI